MVRDVAKHPCRGRHHARLQIVAAGQPRDSADLYTCIIRVRVRIIANELIKNVGKYQSCMVSKLRACVCPQCDTRLSQQSNAAHGREGLYRVERVCVRRIWGARRDGGPSPLPSTGSDFPSSFKSIWCIHAYGTSSSASSSCSSPL